jgi:Flp pilus assembly protein TadD
LPSRSSPSGPLFFEELRAAEARLPAGLVRLGPPASDSDLASVQVQLGRRLPRSLVELLRSFDGADLFHEAVVLCGVGGQAARSLVVANTGAPPPRLHPEELVIGETPTGELFVLEPDDADTTDDPRVFRLSPDADERWLVGSSLARWLASTLAHEQLLYGPDGEFLLDAFEEDGEELTPAFAVRQAERALKKDQQSALYHYELGLAHRRLGRHELARASFAASAALDPPNPWPWFDLGRSERQLGQMRQAAAAFECAAEASSGGERGRFLVWSARSMFEAGDRATAEKLLEEARLSSPGLGDELARAASAAAAELDRQGREDVEELAALVVHGLPTRRKLPVLREQPAPPPARARPSTKGRPTGRPGAKEKSRPPAKGKPAAAKRHHPGKKRPPHSGRPGGKRRG